jgi:putative membrane protein
MEYMEYMFQEGFLGTRAPLFMDFVVIIVALLPLLLTIAVLFAKQGYYLTHIVLQKILFVVSVIVVGYFEYGVRVGGGFNFFMEESGTPHTYAWIVLIVHVLIALAGFIIWLYTLILAHKDHKKRTLPGLYSPSHKSLGKLSYLLIVLTALTGLWVYYLLFMN